MKTSQTNQKAQLLKKLLKECIREVLKEELPRILNESKLFRQNEPHQDFIKDFAPGFLKNKPKSTLFGPIAQNQTYDPIKNILAKTAKSMTQEDIQALKFNHDIINSDAINYSIPTAVTNNTLVQNLGEMDDYTPSNLPNFPFK